MPSTQPIPSTEEFIAAFGAGVASRDRDDARYADRRRGAILDHIAGPSALLFRRVAVRQRDEFRRIYFAEALDEALDEIVEERYRNVAPRVLDAPGEGFAQISRPSAAAGSGTIWAGTRIAVGAGGNSALRFYQVNQDTFVKPTATTLTVPVTALDPGPEHALKVVAGQVPVLRIEDTLWDNTFSVVSMDVGPGTYRERDDALRARVRQERREARLGYADAIRAAMVRAGAAHVAMFASDFLGAQNDHGLNRIFVADQNFQSPAALLLACRQALPSVAICGTSVQVNGIATVATSLNVTITMWSAKFNYNALVDATRGAIVDYFATRENPFYWRFSQIRAAVLRVISGAQQVAVTSGQTEPTFATLFDAVPLTRYVVSAPSINVYIVPPT